MFKRLATIVAMVLAASLFIIWPRENAAILYNNQPEEKSFPEICIGVPYSSDNFKSSRGFPFVNREFYYDPCRSVGTLINTNTPLLIMDGLLGATIAALIINNLYFYRKKTKTT